MKYLTGGLCAVLLCLIAPAVASANPVPDNPPQSPCAHGNPTDLCDHVVVIEEPPGLNCPNGGIKVIIVKGDRDDLVATPLTSTTNRAAA